MDHADPKVLTYECRNAPAHERWLAVVRAPDGVGDLLMMRYSGVSEEDAQSMALEAYRREAEKWERMVGNQQARADRARKLAQQRKAA